MGFGITAGISSTKRYSVQYADKVDTDGSIIEFTTYGGTEEVSTEEYTDAGSFTNAATNGQTGTDLASATIENSLIESNTDYSRETTTTRKCL